MVDAFQAVKDVSDPRLSTIVFNDGGRIGELRAGGDLGTRRYEKYMQWFSDHWPTEADWPKGVRRPKRRSVELDPRIDRLRGQFRKPDAAVEPARATA